MEEIKSTMLGMFCALHVEQRPCTIEDLSAVLHEDHQAIIDALRLRMLTHGDILVQLPGVEPGSLIYFISSPQPTKPEEADWIRSYRQ